jgi:hypothetical protein
MLSISEYFPANPYGRSASQAIPNAQKSPYSVALPNFIKWSFLEQGDEWDFFFLFFLLFFNFFFQLLPFMPYNDKDKEKDEEEEKEFKT